MLLEVLGFLALLLGLALVYKTLSMGQCKSSARLEGKVVIVTGASAGIGKETARDLAERGAKVIMACRNVNKAQLVADDIIATTGNEDVKVMQLDTSDLASVRQFAADFRKQEDKLHILVNNAGMAGNATLEHTADGLEKTMATNHYGHFLLTNLLGDLLKASAPSRVVCVSAVYYTVCSAYDPQDMNFSKGEYTGHKGYASSKLCNVLMAGELASRLEGTGVTAYSVHPGYVRTEIFAKSTGGLLLQLLGIFAPLFGKDEKSGAQTTIYCAVDEDALKDNGGYFADCKVTAKTALALDKDLSGKVWEQSFNDVRLTDEEAKL